MALIRAASAHSRSSWRTSCTQGTLEVPRDSQGRTTQRHTPGTRPNVASGECPHNLSSAQPPPAPCCLVVLTQLPSESSLKSSIRNGPALTHVAQWVGHHPTKQKVTGSIPGQGKRLGCVFGPWSIGEAANQCFSPFISPSLPLCLKIKTNKILKKKKKRMGPRPSH